MIEIPDFAPLWKPLYSAFAWRMGDKGNGAREVQTGLSKIGYELTTDGAFGRKTDWAVKHFQAAQGLVVDGVVGSKTWAALVSAVNG